MVVKYHKQDGDAVARQTLIASVSGPVRSLLTGERTVLNFYDVAQRNCIAAEFVAEVRHTNAVILDTRKTFPGYRLLQKYAVRFLEAERIIAWDYTMAF